MDLSDFEPFKNSVKKVLVTGHTGFKGTWLTLLLEKLGVEVHGLSLAPTAGSLYERINRSGAINEYFVDIRDYEMLQKCVQDIKPDVIFHLAAQPLVLESYRSPLETFQTNVQGTANLLDISFSTSATQLVAIVTTDKVYENNDSGRMFQETDSLKGKDPYSASKVGTESAVAAWQQITEVKGGPKVSSLRAGNVIGGGDYAKERLLPDLIRSLNNQSEILLRNPASTRPWQHVLDPLLGYVMAVQKILTGGEIKSLNFAPDGASLTVKQVADIALSEWGGNQRVKYGAETENIEARTLQLDATKAKSLLGWKPHWTQEDAVRSTVKWWKTVLSEQISAMEACTIDLNHVFINEK